MTCMVQQEDSEKTLSVGLVYRTASFSPSARTGFQSPKTQRNTASSYKRCHEYSRRHNGLQPSFLYAPTQSGDGGETPTIN